MAKKETSSKKLKHQAKSSESNKNKLIELKITHVMPRYEKSKNVEIHDSKLLTVWKDEDSVNVWIGSTIAVVPLERWEELKKEIREMLFKDIKFPDIEDAEDEE